MKTITGIVDEIGFDIKSKKGKLFNALTVAGIKVYDWQKKLPPTVKQLDNVRVQYEGDSFPTLLSIEVLPGSKQATVTETTQAVGDSKEQSTTAPAQSYFESERVVFDCRKTGLNCATALISNKVLAAPTGSESIIALAKDLEHYMRTGENAGTKKVK